jgi:hypothetical protein
MKAAKLSRSDTITRGVAGHLRYGTSGSASGNSFLAGAFATVRTGLTARGSALAGFNPTKQNSEAPLFKSRTMRGFLVSSIRQRCGRLAPQRIRQFARCDTRSTRFQLLQLLYFGCRFDVASAAICSTSATMLRRSLGLGIRMKALLIESPS